MPTRHEHELETAVGSLALSGRPVDDVIARIPASDWVKRPAPHLNHVLWILGHLTVTRGFLVRTFGSRDGVVALDPLFNGGTPVREGDVYPSPSIVISAWRDMAVRLDRAVKTVVPGDLQRPSPEGAPTFNGRVGGALAASVFHEAYHVGQLGYLTRWLGYRPLLGG